MANAIFEFFIRGSRKFLSLAGWQKIGIVVSVLWTVAMLLYITNNIIENNREATDAFKSCLISADAAHIRDSNDSELKAAHLKCKKVYDDTYLGFAENVKPDTIFTVIAWSIVVPLGFFWLVLSAVFVVVDTSKRNK